MNIEMEPDEVMDTDIGEIPMPDVVTMEDQDIA